MSVFPYFGNYWRKSFQRNNGKKTEIVLTTNLSKLLPMNKCLKGFFSQVLAILLLCCKIFLNRGFNSEVLSDMCA